MELTSKTDTGSTINYGIDHTDKHKKYDMELTSETDTGSTIWN